MLRFGRRLEPAAHAAFGSMALVWDPTQLEQAGGRHFPLSLPEVELTVDGRALCNHWLVLYGDFFRSEAYKLFETKATLCKVKL